MTNYVAFQKANITGQGFDYVFEIKMNCMNDIANKTAFERFCYVLEQKVQLTNMGETKFEAGKRIFKCEYQNI